MRLVLPRAPVKSLELIMKQTEINTNASMWDNKAKQEHQKEQRILSKMNFKSQNGVLQANKAFVYISLEKLQCVVRLNVKTWQEVKFFLAIWALSKSSPPYENHNSCMWWMVLLKAPSLDHKYVLYKPMHTASNINLYAQSPALTLIWLDFNIFLSWYIPHSTLFAFELCVFLF